MSEVSPGGALAPDHTARAFMRATIRSSGQAPHLMLASLLAAALALLEGPLAARIPLGLLAVLFLPGYSLTLALFPRAGDLDGVERAALGLGLSLGLIISVLALLLNYTPWGLGHTPLLVALTASTLAACTASIWRRASLPPGDRLVVGPRPERGLTDRPARLALGVLLASGLLAGAALTVTLTAPPSEFTEFFILGPESLAENYPRTVAPGEAVTVTAGISNREAAPASYVVAVADGTDTPLARVGPLQLAPGESWEGRVSFALPGAGDDQEVKLALLKDGQEYAYRSLRLWLDIVPASQAPAASPATVLSPAPVASPLATVASRPAASATPVPSATQAPTSPSVPATPNPTAPAGGLAETGGTYVVEAGDSLVTIAQQFYGDAALYLRLHEANTELLGDDPGALRPGMQLRIPALNGIRTSPTPAASPTRAPSPTATPTAAPRAEPARPPAAARSYTVEAGDSLLTIAKDFYGDAALWPPIYEANKALIGDDPDALRAGTRLTIPAPR
jgi:uncharacterized membrane protein/LysM repeat protein